MTYVSDSIPNLVGGVSQQAAKLRLASQCEEQISATSSILEGLGRRPPTAHVARLTPFDEDLTPEVAAEAAVHTIDRDDTERYKVLIYGETIRVFDFTGDEKTVNTPDGTDYLQCSVSKRALSLTTLIDHTFVVNKEIEVAMEGAVSDARGIEALVFVAVANYSTDYKVTLDGYTATCATLPYGYAAANHISPTGGDGSSGSPVAISSEFIAECLKADLQANHPNHANYSFAVAKSVIWIKRVNLAAFSIEAFDSRGNTQISVAKETAKALSFLPTAAPDGFQVEIVGDAGTAADNYFVTFKSDNPSLTIGLGAWVESVKPGIPVALDPETMPHVLVREEDGTFTFRQVDWVSRGAGDEDTAPTPSFVGRTINDVFNIRNRLGLLAASNASLSAAGEIFSFFQPSATVLTDGDPIDKAASHTKVAVLVYAVPFKKRLFFFSSKTQFELEYGDVLSNETSEIVPLTELEGAIGGRPIGAGKTMFMPLRREGATGIQEYVVDDETGSSLGDDQEITAHVPTYIPAGLSKQTVAVNENTLALLTDETPRSLYVYRYFWQGREKLLSSWSRFDYYGDDADARILDAEFTVDECYLVATHVDGVYLERFSMAPKRTDPNSAYAFALDRKITEAACDVDYDSLANVTTITAPFILSENFVVVARFPDDHTKTPGGTATTVEIDEDEIKVFGDWSDAKFYLGEKYRTRYVFSPQFLRKASAGGGREVVGTGRLQMKFWIFHYDRTGYFEVVVTPRGREAFRHQITPRSIGTPEATIGSPPIGAGQFRVPIMAKNDEVEVAIESDSHLPMHVLSVEWDGDYTSPSRRL
ncbi:hypothetical protein GIW81_00885 [Hyphomicrobium sp. xq]|uniref:Tail tubular protein B n=1 Tax=Hyphomicrobium album TaxID=2665159 RepID=A0A6I3KEX1_9HYPH|nr:hypothetical protein [Hyphomicrobium album]MTD92883.1 hypothetical protein [Hyphomicrobium album]